MYWGILFCLYHGSFIRSIDDFLFHLKELFFFDHLNEPLLKFSYIVFSLFGILFSVINYTCIDPLRDRICIYTGNVLLSDQLQIWRYPYLCWGGLSLIFFACLWPKVHCDSFRSSLRCRCVWELCKKVPDLWTPRWSLFGLFNWFFIALVSCVFWDPG